MSDEVVIAKYPGYCDLGCNRGGYTDDEWEFGAHRLLGDYSILPGHRIRLNDYEVWEHVDCDEYIYDPSKD